MTKKKTNTNWSKQIKKAIIYSEKKEYEVLIKKLPQGISYIDFDSKVIMIHSGYTKERQLYTILHELGHFLINHEQVKKYNKTLGYQYRKFSKNSVVYKVTEIEEEIEAWKLGYQLSKKLGIKVNRHNFEVFKSSMLSTYITRHNNKNNKNSEATENNGKRKI